MNPLYDREFIIITQKNIFSIFFNQFSVVGDQFTLDKLHLLPSQFRGIDEANKCIGSEDKCSFLSKITKQISFNSLLKMIFS